MGLPPRDKAATRLRQGHAACRPLFPIMGKRGPQPGAATKAAAAAKKAKAAPTAPKAQGTTTKRTPSGTFDPAAGKETYEPEEIHSLQRSTLTDHLTPSVQF